MIDNTATIATITLTFILDIGLFSQGPPPLSGGGVHILTYTRMYR